MTEAPSVHRARTGQITFLVALAVFAAESTWNFYDSQVPPLLREHIGSAAVVGFLMGMDNLLGVFIQPWIGNRSDNTRTSWGRRMPYLVVGMPAAALLFLAIPFAASNLVLLIVVIFAFSLVANSFKPVAEALLPDFIPPERRSRANAALRVAASLTAILAAVISIVLIDDHPNVAFAIPSILGLVAVAVLAAKVRDSRSPAYLAALEEDGRKHESPKPQVRVRDLVADIVRDSDRSRLLVMVAVLAFSGAWAGVRALATPYAMEVLGLSRGDAGGLALPSGVAFLLAAYPSAMFAERFGRLRVIMAGLVIFALGMVFGTVVPTVAGTIVAFCLLAAGASAFMVNAMVVLWNLAPSSRVHGAYTGLFTVAFVGGGFLGPALIGGMVDLAGWRSMLIDTALVALVAVLAAARVGARQRRSPGSHVL